MDVFLSHNSTDKLMVTKLAERLDDAGYQIWYDKWNLVPGDPWQEEMEKALDKADCIVVFLGTELGPWHHEELRIALEDRVKNKVRVVPVLLPGTIKPENREIPRFLRLLLWVAFKNIEDEQAFQLLLCGIDGKRPGRAQTPSRLEPEPIFDDERIEGLFQKLGEARVRQEQQTIAGESTVKIREKILALQSQLRKGGQRHPGEVLSSRYKLIDVLGKGGFAKVWKAYDREKYRHVAIKMLHSQYSDDRTRRERFFRGARKMGALHHPGIVRVLAEECEDEGFYFFVMAYWNSLNLREQVLQSKLDQNACLNVILVVGEALSHAHTNGLVHRDIKPQNILLDRENRACLTDFDLVKAADSTGGTRTQSGMGTFIYAAPELLSEARSAGVPADIYGLGMTALFTLYRKDLPMEVVRNANVFINSLNCALYLKKAISKAVAWHAEERFSSVEAFCAALEPPGKVQPQFEADIMATPDPKSVDLESVVDPGQDMAHNQGAGTVSWWNRSLTFFARTVSLIGFPNKVEKDPLLSRVSDKFNLDDRWVFIKPGEFTMGDNQAILKDEKPAHRVRITDGFWLGRYQVTNREYRMFIEAGGYQDRHYWSGKGWEWLQFKGKEYEQWYAKTKKTYAGQSEFPSPKKCKPGTKPFFWNNAQFNAEDQPVVGISWFEASAYCKWLSKLMADGLVVVLPSEAQWEWAARGGESRKSPWGESPPTDKLANFGNKKWKTSAVGSYPRGVTKEGLQDMAGNVWEWCQDHWSHDVYINRKAGAKNPIYEHGDAAVRVLRGGAWNSSPDLLRASYRCWSLAWSRGNGVGFRCCLLVRSSPEND